MNITQLRNDLLHFCSSEITGVTLADLKECNWKTQKIVYSGIIQTSNRLKVYQEQLVLLNENRARNLTMLRSQVGSRDDRKQIEIEYRHRFLELIANILCELKWPPTLEPFSNPLRLLTEEIEYKLGAMRFLLDSAVFKPSRQMSWKSYGGMEPDANSELTPRSSNDNSIKRESLPQSDVLAADQNDVVLSRVDRSPSSMHSRNEDNSPTIASTKLDYSYFDYHLLFQSHQILQNQCEVLSKQLKFIKVILPN